MRRLNNFFVKDHALSKWKFLIIIFLLFSESIIAQSNKKPNILFCIADDASYRHFGAYEKTNWVNTPTFDSLAKNGLLFQRAYTPNAKCSPSRSIILTGRNSWQLGAAANHNPNFPSEFVTVTETLRDKGYFVGFTGKGWAPGNPGKVDGKPRQLIGKKYNTLKLDPPTNSMSAIDYASNFKEFLIEKPDNEPFFFWFGSREPHRAYEFNSGVKKAGKKISDIQEVPEHWIDNETVRRDMLDYAYEVEYFDLNLQKILKVLKESGELNNTIIVVTSDNGMPFPRVKGHVYEHDNHMPLVVYWQGKIHSPGRVIKDFVSFADFAPTFLDIAGVNARQTKMKSLQGKSLMPIINSYSGNLIDPSNDHVILGRERQDVGRPHDEGFPVRALVSRNYIYTKNYEPDRWPSGNPETGYLDTDSSPTKTEILESNRNNKQTNAWLLSFGKKPVEELYKIDKDLNSLKNLAQDTAYTKIKNELKNKMENELKKQGDPRMYGEGNKFDRYIYSKESVRNYYTRFMNNDKSLKIRSKKDIDNQFLKDSIP